MMTEIHILDEKTIDQIAAGEVVDRPVNVVKELVENAIDSGADSVTVEIKEGGIKLIRVTDNGHGIAKSEIKKAFMRHATSKIIDASDLMSIQSLGFRGEALSSICAVSSVEVISKEHNELMGYRYLIEGSKELEISDIGAPDGTTIIVRDLFFNVPVRRKFLKTPATEGGYIAEMMEHLALSHPEISINFIMNGKVIFTTSGNEEVEEVIYRIYGKDIKDRLLKISSENDYFKLKGYILKPEVAKSNRTFENFFINGRFVQCDVISKAVEEGYRNFLMQHKFPFVFLYFDINAADIDVNVHPSKMMIRLHNQEVIYDLLSLEIKKVLSDYELIPSVKLVDEPITQQKANKVIEPFEIIRKQNEEPLKIDRSFIYEEITDEFKSNFAITEQIYVKEKNEKSFDLTENLSNDIVIADVKQTDLFEDKFLKEESKESYRILGQIFKTFWLIEFDDKLFFMDQHAAHEKVKYERLLKQIQSNSVSSQILNPPIIVSLSTKEEACIEENRVYFEKLGFELEDFGLGSVAIRAIPTDLYGRKEDEFFRDILDELIDNPMKKNSDVILDKIASMACKAAVKGNNKLSMQEVSALLDELMTLDNPYNCPHGRPTIFSMSKYEIDKKFKRIVD